MKRTNNKKRIRNNTTRKSKNTKMDVVITHVNGDSPGFQEAFEKTKKTHYNPEVHTTDSILPIRFKDNGELKYVLRSIAKNMSCVRNVYLVIDEYTEVPKWMKNVKIVRHKDIFQEYSNHLPNFNSNAIDSVLHRILGLSEHFIYINNDMFVCRPIQSSDLYKHDKIAMFYENKISLVGIPNVNENGFDCSWKNANKILNDTFGTYPRRFLRHAPFTLSKQLLQTLWKKYPEQLSNVIQTRFRSTRDFDVACTLHPYYAFHTGKTFTPKHIQITYTEDTSELNRIYNHLPHFLCINDKSVESTKSVIVPFLEKIFPEKSKYEK